LALRHLENLLNLLEGERIHFGRGFFEPLNVAYGIICDQSILVRLVKHCEKPVTCHIDPAMPESLPARTRALRIQFRNKSTNVTRPDLVDSLEARVDGRMCAVRSNL
jgi:hypothetical protein